MIAEHLIEPKTNEVPGFAPLLRELHAHTPTVRARDHRRHRAHRVRPRPVPLGELGAHYVMTVTTNTRTLFIRSARR